ncbi:enoyl-CoA hydratase/isomerase family protein [Rhodococcus globerulus]|uniref:enoyl-CoA hydratase/isomerase family protein n=1 Tax=Rhodococcus globerulus TaxID=33008 RepID=UPI00301A0A72
MFIEDSKYEGRASGKFRAFVVDHPSITPPRALDDYRERYADKWMLDRTDNGVLTAKWHTDGHDLEYGVGFHRSIGQLMEDVGQDPDNEVLIVGGHGDTFLKKFKDVVNERPNMPWYLYEHMFQDGTRMVESLVSSLRIPTIGVINGDGYHSEIAVLCDLTLMAEDAVISDPHFIMGGIPGDGIQTVLRNTLGIKRANYAMLMHDQFDAQKALDYGLVNEVVPRDRIYERAQEIAQFIMTKPRIIRRMTSEILKQPWRKAFAEELRSNFAAEMWGFMVNTESSHESGFAAVEEWRRVYEGAQAPAEETRK